MAEPVLALDVDAVRDSFGFVGSPRRGAAMAGGKAGTGGAASRSRGTGAPAKEAWDHLDANDLTVNLDVLRLRDPSSNFFSSNTGPASKSGFWIGKTGDEVSSEE